jgi:hypothetical protein
MDFDKIMPTLILMKLDTFQNLIQNILDFKKNPRDLLMGLFLAQISLLLVRKVVMLIFISTFNMGHVWSLR